MKRYLEPKVLLAVASLILVGLLALSDIAAPGPGPLHPTHAALSELSGRDGCAVCHGDDGSPESMMAGCSSCHADIATQLTAGTGLHGVMGGSESGAPDIDAARCAQCHGEHLGAAIKLVDDAAFARAGFADVSSFEHTQLGYTLEGSHAELDCTECHANALVDLLPEGERRFIGLQQECVACHEDPHKGEMTRGCAECHGQEAPFDTVALFEHTSRFALEGSHAAVACVDCHAPDSDWSIERSGAATPAEDRTCVDCHDSPHDPSFVADARASCVECHAANRDTFHDVPEATMSALHDATGFALEDAHAAVDCAACHDPDLPFAERFPGRVADDCTACHDDPHGGQFTGRPGDETSCAGCHNTHAFAPPAIDVDIHSLFGFVLDGAHAAAECAACHVASKPGDVIAFRGTPQECAECHADVHRGAFAPSRPRSVPAATITVVVECAQCHGTDEFSPLAVDEFDHGHWTGFALAGAHTSLECRSCHGPSSTQTRSFGWVADTFPGSVERCDTCHDSPHGDQFDSRANGADALDCAVCHVSTDFQEIVPGSFDHVTATGFALDGAHSQARCTSCHIPTANGERRLGDVRLAFDGPVDRCATCHMDPHGGAFGGEGASRSADGEFGCARCHQPLSFRTVDSFDHGKWTSWMLSGAHADATCADCHRPQPKDNLGRSSAFAAGTECADCHADPHLGQFGDTEGRSDCASCHDANETFQRTTFDHDTARFKLDETHAPLACASCHRAAGTTDGRNAVRFRPLGRECGDCHDPTGNGGRGGAPRKLK